MSHTIINMHPREMMDAWIIETVRRLAEMGAIRA